MTFVNDMARRGRALTLAVALVAVAPAWAADPSADVSVTTDGLIVGTIVVPAAESEVRQWIDDPVAMGKLSEQVLSVESARDGDCVSLTTRTRGLFRPMLFKSRRCPTADGWLEQLVESDDFSAYESRWEVKAVDGGTQVTLRLRSKVTMAVPEAVVQSSARRSLGDLLVALVQHVVRRNPR